MKTKFLMLFLLLNFSINFAQVGIGNTIPEAALDVTSATSGLLIPRVALTAKNVVAPVTNPKGGAVANSTLIFNTATAGTAPNNVVRGYYYWDTIALLWIYLGNDPTIAPKEWRLSGNSGTTPATNFIGTTDANDLIFKTNNIQRLKIDNATNVTTGTTGDIEVGDINSGTFRANKELVMRQDGDVYGTSILRLRNRNAENGAIYQTAGGPTLVDFIFRTGPIASPISSNIRFEARASSLKVTGNTTEWQFGQPDNLNGGPTLVIGASGTGGSGSNSSIRIGNFGIGNTNPSEKLDVTGNLKISGAFMPNNISGTTGQILVSKGTGTAPTWDSNPIKPIFNTTLTGVYNVLIDDHTVRVGSASTGVNLPSAVTNRGKTYIIIGRNGIASMPFTTSGGSILDDVTNSTITTLVANSRYLLQSDGTNWYVIGR